MILILLVAVCAPVIAAGVINLERAQTASEEKDFSATATYYAAAARLSPWNPELWEMAALAQVSASQSGEAMVLFEKARRQNALSVSGWQTYGSLYWNEGKYQQALDTWSAGLKQYPTALEFYAAKAVAYKSLHQYSAERTALETWLATGRGSAREYYELGLIVMAPEPERALELFNHASSMDPTLQPATESLRSSIELAARAPNASTGLVFIGRALGLVNEWPLAEQAFEQAVEANEQNAEAWAWLGESRQQIGVTGKSELDRAMALQPDNTFVRALRALYWKRQGDDSAEIAEYLKAAQLEPGNPEWQAALGGAYTSRGDLVSALTSYQQAAALGPENAIYLRLLAAFCADNAIHVMDIGLPAAKKAAELAPNDAQVLDALGWSFAQAGLIYNAEQSLHKALNISPDLPIAHLHLAETYLRKGDQTSALHELKLVHQLDAEGPAGEFAQRLLDQYFP